MPFSKQTNLCFQVNYKPAVLKHIKNCWLVEYYALNPQTQELTRFRTKLNAVRKRYATAAEFKQYANTIVNQINAKLFGGWSPFFESENTRLYTKLSDVINQFTQEKSKELRPATLRTYTSWCNLFSEWANKNIPGVFVSMINKVIAIRYMEYMYNKRGVSNRTYNNNVKQGRVFFNWCIEKCYAKENPFEQITKKRNAEKKRIMIPEATRAKITEYLKKTNPNFLTVCKLVYSALIRPKEIRMIRIKDIHLKEHYIYIPPENAKNHHGRVSAISDSLCAEIETIMKEAKSDNMYLIGPLLHPSVKVCPEAYMHKYWDRMRKALNLPDEMQLYSLRDTGINNMIKSGIDPLTVMQHADHHDLSMTTRYANHADEGLIDKIRAKAPEF